MTTDPTTSMPRFVDAERQHEALIASCGRPRAIACVFREDLRFVQKRLYVCTTHSSESSAIVRERYDAAMISGLGAELLVAAVADDSSYCSLWVPPSDLDAQLRMVSGLKVSVPTRPDEATVVDDRREWKRLCAKASPIFRFIDELQFRCEAG